jgi:hypothetical protein
MLILHVILLLIVIGMCLYAVNRWVPMAQSIKTILNVFVVIAVIMGLLYFFGVPGYLGSFRFGRL